MKFKMNDLEWEIKETSAEEVKSNFNDENKESVYFGCAQLSTQTIFLNNEVSLEKKRQTLYHELMHCYIYCFLGDEIGFANLEEGICEISSKSHDMIHRIVEEYFSPKLIIQQPDIKLTPEMIDEMQNNVVLYSNDVNTTVTRRKTSE